MGPQRGPWQRLQQALSCLLKRNVMLRPGDIPLSRDLLIPAVLSVVKVLLRPRMERYLITTKGVAVCIPRCGQGLAGPLIDGSYRSGSPGSHSAFVPLTLVWPVLSYLPSRAHGVCISVASVAGQSWSKRLAGPVRCSRWKAVCFFLNRYTRKPHGATASSWRARLRGEDWLGEDGAAISSRGVTTG